MAVFVVTSSLGVIFFRGQLKRIVQNSKLIYRHYATLYFIFIVDGSESELGILDLIQVREVDLDLVQL